MFCQFDVRLKFWPPMEGALLGVLFTALQLVCSASAARSAATSPHRTYRQQDFLSDQLFALPLPFYEYSHGTSKRIPVLVSALVSSVSRYPFDQRPPAMLPRHFAPLLSSLSLGGQPLPAMNPIALLHPDPAQTTAALPINGLESSSPHAF